MLPKFLFTSWVEMRPRGTRLAFQVGHGVPYACPSANPRIAARPSTIHIVKERMSPRGRCLHP